jgi:Tol biopolymer transport system component
MIKSITAKLSLLFLLVAITTCYYEREINEELEICFIRGGNIWIMDMDGSNQRQITFLGNTYSPSWSPDGKRILFERNSEIYIINSDRTGLKKLIDSTLGINQFPTWSADGEKIYYYETDVTHSIVTAKPDGTIIRRYTLTSSISSFSPSPDGKYIYYSPGSILRKIDIEKESDDFITNNPTKISFSPDGNSIAYSDGSSISLYHIDTGNITFIAPAAQFPCWTPDGKTIVYTSGNNLYRINIDGTNQKPLTSTADCSSPCVKWKPK